MLEFVRATTAAIVFGVLAFAGSSAMPGSSEASGNQFQLDWGDLNCSDEVQSVDAVYPLRHVAGLNVYIANGICDPRRVDMFPESLLQIEDGPQVQWADVDCSGKITAVDALRVLRHVAGLPNTVAAGCPEIGALTSLSFVQ